MNKQSLNLLLLSIVAVAFTVVILFQNPQECVIRSATGIHCPGCGGKRALGQLSDGNLLYSLQCNLLLIPVILLIIWALLSLVFRNAMRQMVISKRVSLVLIIVIALYTITRNFEGMSILRP